MAFSSQFEAVVVGGGLAGTAAAMLLARAGARIVLIEQHAAAHHKVCGEFLSAEAVQYLGQLGLDLGSLGALAITHVGLAAGRGARRAALPFPALSLTRQRLDEALLKQAACAGVHVVRGQAVESLTPELTEARWRATLRSGESFAAPHALLATGKHDLRGLPRPPGRQNHLVAFKQYFALSHAQTAALDGTVELSLFPGGYAGLQPVEPHLASSQPRANLCLVVDRTRYRALGGSWPSLLYHLTTQCPLLRDRLLGAAPLLPKPLALSRIPYGMLLRGMQRTVLPGGSAVETLWPLGDQAEVIPSFTGDGMSLALHTGFLAAQCLRRGLAPEEYHRQLYMTAAGQIRRATAVSQLLLTRLAQPLAAVAGPLLPAVLRQLARATRIQPEALLTAGAVLANARK